MTANKETEVRHEIDRLFAQLRDRLCETSADAEFLIATQERLKASQKEMILKAVELARCGMQPYVVLDNKPNPTGTWMSAEQIIEKLTKGE